MFFNYTLSTCTYYYRLCTEQVRNSPSDCGAMVRAFMECAQYSGKQAQANTDQTAIAQFVLIDQVRKNGSQTHHSAVCLKSKYIVGLIKLREFSFGTLACYVCAMSRLF